MRDRSFEIVIPFVQVPNAGWYPLVQVTFLKPNRQKLYLPLLFDTGADQILMHPDWEWAFPNLQPCKFGGIGGEVNGKNVHGQVEFCGQVVDCEIGIGPKEMESKTWMAGVVGRDCFKPFGFGFWESAHELYVTLNL